MKQNQVQGILKNLILKRREGNKCFLLEAQKKKQRKLSNGKKSTYVIKTRRDNEMESRKKECREGN